ncbi:transcriptional regulator, GntR family [Ammonifex degensii KC4]|uniref:Transcriptional regulator, GntR family n=1 Tax=Ammonifex degensii (strain DSM 10501 / KC4) TaxID=429009 RepID=C9RA44_AMMDK|nr:GntR family transcriptional regulator [Ammonifex degensii]ACX53173.1 transcriptional regulator, GntR family [Ammonifex degensii KC4]
MRRLLPVKLDNYKPLRDVVFESLREAIIKGILKPGERLMELQLAEELGVSRTPVREALRKLELEGLVVMLPRRGAYVAGLSAKDIADIFEVRAALEALAAGLAAERITEEELEALERSLVELAEVMETNDLEAIVSLDTRFHEIIYRASRNDRLVQIISNLQDQIHRFRLTTLSRPGRTRETIEEHKKIVEAISERQAELAAQLAREHIENAESNLLASLLQEGENDSRDSAGRRPQ